MFRSSILNNLNNLLNNAKFDERCGIRVEGPTACLKIFRFLNLGKIDDGNLFLRGFFIVSKSATGIADRPEFRSEGDRDPAAVSSRLRSEYEIFYGQH